MDQTFSVRTVILHQRLHLLLDPLVPLGDVDVQRVVAAGLAVSPFAPLLEGGHEADAGLGNHMVNWTCEQKPEVQPELFKGANSV